MICRALPDKRDDVVDRDDQQNDEHASEECPHSGAYGGRGKATVSAAPETLPDRERGSPGAENPVAERCEYRQVVQRGARRKMDCCALDSELCEVQEAERCPPDQPRDDQPARSPLRAESPSRRREGGRVGGCQAKTEQEGEQEHRDRRSFSREASPAKRVEVSCQLQHTLGGGRDARS
jgi:hypothetical protein